MHAHAQICALFGRPEGPFIRQSSVRMRGTGSVRRKIHHVSVVNELRRTYTHGQSGAHNVGVCRAKAHAQTKSICCSYEWVLVV